MRRTRNKEAILLTIGEDANGVHTIQLQKLSRRSRIKSFTPEEVQQVLKWYKKLEFELLGYNSDDSRKVPDNFPEMKLL